MKCINDKKILDYINGELSEQDKKSTAKHLKECEDCRNRYKNWKKTVSLSQDFIKEDMSRLVSPKFELNNHKRIPGAEESRRSLIRLWLKPALATAAVLILSLAVFFFPKQDKEIPETNYMFTSNDYLENEIIEITESNFTNIEEAFTQEIYSDDNAINKIFFRYNMSDNPMIGEDVANELTEDQIKYLQSEIENMRGIKS